MLKIYLCDFVHNYLGLGTYMFPLNIGCLAAYAKKAFPAETDISLFKYPEDFIARCKEVSPQIAGFSNYTWNADLNKRVSGWLKGVLPDTLVVFGGPNIDLYPQGYIKFFTNYKAADCYVPYQGEAPFANILREVLGSDRQMSRLGRRSIEGVVSYDRANATLSVGSSLPHIKDLDALPSPYLSGTLDKFFDTALIPIMETNRGCPYGCTFCAQGENSRHQISFFDLRRVKDELSYIARRVKNTNILNFADSNFGIAARDKQIAGYIARLAKETGYPRKFNTNWAKGRPAIAEIAQILPDSSLIISLQSLDRKVLRNIKRSNSSTAGFRKLIRQINLNGGISATELILGLPGESKESHLNALRRLFKWGVAQITCYNGLLLQGTQMSLQREMGKTDYRTKYRLIDNSFGRYGSILSFEGEEGIRATASITEKEVLYFRPVHWLVQFLWNYAVYLDLLKYLQARKINPLDYILKVITLAKSKDAPKRVKAIFREFEQEAFGEWFATPLQLRSYYSKPKNFQMLKDGQYGKLNGKYIFRVLLEAKADFERHLLRTAESCLRYSRVEQGLMQDIINFSSASIIDFSLPWGKAAKGKTISCRYDILSWRMNKRKGDLGALSSRGGFKYRFYLPEGQSRALATLLRQYRHKNKNAMLRKMSELMNLKDLFYAVEPIHAC